MDAVIIGTSDHWHVPITVAALAAGKHVYCEKPMVQHWEEGHQVIDAQKRYGRVVQVGSQRVSSVVYLKARDLLASGAIGELNMIDAWWSRNSPIGAWHAGTDRRSVPRSKPFVSVMILALAAG